MSVKLTDKQMEKILPVLRTFPEIRLGLPRQSRRFLEAVLWITRSGAQWRLLPPNTAIGILFINALIVGADSAFLKNCSSI
jgi:transposase